MNEGFGGDFNRKGNSVKRFGPFTKPPGPSLNRQTLKLKSCCPHPLPENQLIIGGEGSCESKIAARQWGVNFCCEASRCLAGPSGSGNCDKKWRKRDKLPEYRD